MTDEPTRQDPTAAAADRHGWIGTEVVRTRFGDFAFENGYPTRAAAGALLDQLVFNRAVEVYLTQIPPVAVIETRRGFREFGAATPQQVLIWESMMDAQTLLLTANTETVYGLGFLDLRGDGPTALEAPARMFGNAMDFLQRFLVDVGPLGPDKGEGGKYLFLPPGYDGEVPDGYFVVESPTFNVIFGLRGFKVDGKNDFLDGARDYVLRIPADVPVNNFWSVVVYDALSRSELRNDQPLPSVSQYTGPRANDDGTVDLYFGRSMPDGQAGNWIQTVPGRGWFPIFRAYGPLEPYFDKTWKLNDIQKR